MLKRCLNTRENERCDIQTEMENAKRIQILNYSAFISIYSDDWKTYFTLFLLVPLLIDLTFFYFSDFFHLFLFFVSLFFYGLVCPLAFTFLRHIHVFLPAIGEPLSLSPVCISLCVFMYVLITFVYLLI